jgi:hypothetical protein
MADELQPVPGYRAVRFSVIQGYEVLVVEGMPSGLPTEVMFQIADLIPVEQVWVSHPAAIDKVRGHKTMVLKHRQSVFPDALMLIIKSEADNGCLD